MCLLGLLPEWNKGPHAAAYVDFAADPSAPRPWAAAAAAAADLAALRARLELELESLAHRAVRLGAVGSREVFAALNKWHGLRTALRRVVGPARLSRRDDDAAPASALWSKAVLALSGRIGAEEIEGIVAAAAGGGGGGKYTREEVAYMKEAAVALRLAKEVIGMQQEWRSEAVRHLNRTGGFSRSLVNSATDWPCLLLEILSEAAEVGFFQVS